MLRLQGVTVTRGGRAVLNGADLHVAAGEMVVMMGRSGIGKTSLLHVAAGLLAPSAGRVVVSGRLTMVFQEPRLLPWRSALDNAALGLRALGMPRAERRACAATLLHELGLDAGHFPKLPHALSGGMRQRVAIARALAVEPAVLLLDEPFAALDAGLRTDLQQHLRTAVARRGVAALLATHDLVEAVRLGGRLVVLGGWPARPVLQLALPVADTDAEVFAVCADLLRRPDIAAGLGLAAPGNDPAGGADIEI